MNIKKTIQETISKAFGKKVKHESKHHSDDLRQRLQLVANRGKLKK